MTGVLSESDMKVIKGVADNIGIITDDDGNVKRISGSYDETYRKLKTLQSEIRTRLNDKGVYLEGQTAADGAGNKIIFTGGQWVDANGNPI